MNGTPTSWTRQAVQIATGTEDAPRRTWVNGYTSPDAPGLAVTPTTAHDRDQMHHWSVTHLLTGREIAEGSNEKAAKRIAFLIAPIAKWDGPLEDLIARGTEIAAAVQLAVSPTSGRVNDLTPAHRRPSHAEMCERKAVGYLLKALQVHDHRSDSEAAARIRGALSYLDK